MDLAGLGHDGVSEDGLRRSHESGTEFSKDNGHLSQVPRSQESESNHFQKAISAWRSIDLGNLIPKLDGVASDIVTYQRDSLVQRKDLAQKTKDFRKLDEATKLAEIKSLLKAYQSFIDVLTTYSKSASSAFLQVYSPLAEAPDPYPLLDASVEALVLSEDTLPKLTEENRHLQQTVGTLSAQLEETEKLLQEERRAKESLEKQQETKAHEVEKSWQAVLDEKRDNWEAKERGLEEKIESQERLLKELKANYEVSQRLDRAENAGDGHANDGATAAELEIVVSDLERTSLRLAEVEARNEQLRFELAQVVSHSHNAARTGLKVEDDPEFLRVQTENSSLRRKVEAARLHKESEQRAWESKLRTLERDVGQYKAERDSLRNKLDNCDDYEEVKRELEMLKSIEFATGEDDDTQATGEVETTEGFASDAAANGVAHKSKAETLEQLLMSRNKKLSNELTLLRVSHQDLQKRLQSLQDDLVNTKADLEKSQQLNSTLENDLLRVQKEAVDALPPPAASGDGPWNPYPQSPATGGRRSKISPTSSIISGFNPSASQTSLETLRAGEPVGGGSGILPMVTAQRDRFKQRNAQLEEELSKSYSTVSSLRQEIASLQKDNLSLYEKTRYVSSFHRGQAATTSSSLGPSQNSNPSTIDMSPSASAGPSFDRYRSAYEANLSPFAAFRGRESARAYRRMAFPERVVLSVTRMILASRTSRNLFAGYCLALHLLVFSMLYWMSSVEIERHASKLGEATLGAVGAAGGPLLGDAQKDGHHGDWHQEGFGGGG